MGARRVQNLLTTEYTNSTYWYAENGATLSVSGEAFFPGSLVNENAFGRTLTSGTGRTYSGRIRLKAKNPGDVGKKLRLGIQNNGPTYNSVYTPEITLTADWVTYGFVSLSNAGTDASGGVRLRISQAPTPNAVTFLIEEPQLEDVTGQVNKNPSEYVSLGNLAAPYHGAGVDGVKYFATKNGNTVSSNIVTEATGAAIGSGDYYADASGPFGYVAEGARTNLCLWGRDFSNAAWVKTNVTAVKDATGRDGAAAVASTLTATASNGTCRQTVTSASATRTISCDIKRKTGTGTIEMTVDGGSTYTDITSQINGSTWARVQVTQAAVTNPSVGFRIGTSGDAIYVDYFGLESASFASSRIHTTTAAVTRNAGSGSYASSSNITTANGVMVLEWTPPYTGMGTVALWGSYVDANNYTRIFHDGTNIVFRRRVSGVNYDATKALTYAAGTTYKIAARISNATGGDVFIAGVKGTNSPNTSALQLGANFSVGHDGNGANHSFAPIRNVKHYDTALTDEQVAAL